MDGWIDIIVPVWNGALYLEKFIDGIMEQTYQKFILHFVYDMSKDNTLEILTRYQRNYKEKINILYSPQKCGQGAARDFAVDSGVICGDYVIFLDADDYPEKNFLEKMVDSARTYHVDMVMCGFDCFEDGTGKTISVQMTNNERDLILDVKEYRKIAFVNPAVWNKLYRREVIEKVRFGKARSMEDGLYIAKILPYVHSIKIINEVLYHYRVSNNSAQARIAVSEFKERWNYYVEMAREYETKNEIYAPYVDIFELITFVKCAIGLTYRTVFLDMKNKQLYINYSREMLDKLVPGWRVNKELQVRYFFKRNMKANAVAVCALLYKIHCFGLFISIYYLYTKLFHREVRW